MHHRLRAPAATLLLFLTMAICFYVLTRLSLLTQRVEVSNSPDSLLLKAGVPLQGTESGAVTQDPSYFWGRLEDSEAEASRLLRNLAAKSGIPVSEPGDRASLAANNDTSTQVASLLGPTWYDPRISIREAMSQVPRVSSERQLNEAEVSRLVRQYTEGTWFGLLGEPQVNVRDLNRALDQLTGG